MTRTLLPLFAAPVGLALLLVATAGPATSQGGGSVVTPGGGSTPFEPILIHDVVGGTLTGTVHTHLTIYNNGFATVAKLHDSVLTGSVEKDVATAALTPAEVQQLRLDLRASSASTLPDQPAWGADVPLSTMTVLRGGTDALAHTFSYQFASGAYDAPAAVVQGLMEQHFPGF